MFTSENVGQISKCYQDVFKDSVDAQFMWTARTEIEDRWSYIDSWDRGWTNPSELEKIELPGIVDWFNNRPNIEAERLCIVYKVVSSLVTEKILFVFRHNWLNVFESAIVDLAISIALVYFS